MSFILQITDAHDEILDDCPTHGCHRAFW